jgi:hypothetical protein
MISDQYVARAMAISLDLHPAGEVVLSQASALTGFQQGLYFALFAYFVV